MITATQWIPPDGYVPKAEREAQEAETHDNSDAESAPSPSESEEDEEEDMHGIKRKHVSSKDSGFIFKNMANVSILKGNPFLLYIPSGN